MSWVPPTLSFIGFLLAQSITIFLSPYVCSLHICSPIHFSFYSCKNNKILLPGFAAQFLSMCEYLESADTRFLCGGSQRHVCLPSIHKYLLRHLHNKNSAHYTRHSGKKKFYFLNLITGRFLPGWSVGKYNSKDLW